MVFELWGNMPDGSLRLFYYRMSQVSQVQRKRADFVCYATGRPKITYFFEPHRRHLKKQIPAIFVAAINDIRSLTKKSLDCEPNLDVFTLGNNLTHPSR